VPTDKRARQKAARREKVEAQRRADRRRTNVRRGGFVVIVAVVIITTVALLVSSGGKSTTTTSPGHPTDQTQANNVAVAAGCPASPTSRANLLHWSSPPPMTINTSKPYYAHIQTTQGPIVVQLLPKQAPMTVNNFVFLANQGYYNCNIFHRVITGFMNQTGDPTGTGSAAPGAPPGYTFKDELPPPGNPTYPQYSVAMANSGPNTNGSEFFITVCTDVNNSCLSDSYSLFGKVVAGTQAVNWINEQGSAGGTPTVVNRMLKVTISSTQ
jgi:cyclophilin family peptidyl-prolyl cis-trans isomerase